MRSAPWSSSRGPARTERRLQIDSASASRYKWAMLLQDKTVLITGVGRGLGRECATSACSP